VFKVPFAVSGDAFAGRTLTPGSVNQEESRFWKAGKREGTSEWGENREHVDEA
jgi:hypothetical protein